jgi:cytochrome c biogenesis protein CcmG/thiol:disulfide interchange protein DsbE
MLAPRQERKPARRRHIITFVVITLFNVGLLALLWTQLLTPAQTSSVASQNGTPTSSDPLIGQTAPDFTLASLTSQTNQQISLTEYKGKPVVLNFWSSTCAPCQDEIPLLESQWERYQAQGVVFLGVDVEDTPVDGRLFLHQYGMTYPSVIDSNGSTLVSYGVTYTPETIFIDRTGKVVSAVRMEITSQQLQAGLTKLLG